MTDRIVRKPDPHRREQIHRIRQYLMMIGKEKYENDKR